LVEVKVLQAQTEKVKSVLTIPTERLMKLFYSFSVNKNTENKYRYHVQLAQEADRTTRLELSSKQNETFYQAPGHSFDIKPTILSARGIKFEALSY
jgi:hypothetical protein